MQAYRAVYDIFKGVAIPPHLEARHTCDNPICVNPDHIIPGTRQENVQDAIDRDRLMRGSKHVNSKISETQVKEMRNLRAGGLSFNKIGDVFGVSWSTARMACLRQTWRHVA